MKVNCIEQNFTTVSPHFPLKEVVTLMSGGEPTFWGENNAQKASCVLVVEENSLLGLLTERDIVKLTSQNLFRQNQPIADVMIQKIITYQESDIGDYFELIRLMQTHQIRHLPILNKEQLPIGIVTSA